MGSLLQLGLFSEPLQQESEVGVSRLQHCSHLCSDVARYLACSEHGCSAGFASSSTATDIACPESGSIGLRLVFSDPGEDYRVSDCSRLMHHIHLLDQICSLRVELQ